MGSLARAAELYPLSAGLRRGQAEVCMMFLCLPAVADAAFQRVLQFDPNSPDILAAKVRYSELAKVMRFEELPK